MDLVDCRRHRKTFIVVRYCSLPSWHRHWKKKLVITRKKTVMLKNELTSRPASYGQ